MARIQVRHRVSGQMGTIDENQFDPVSFEALSETKKDPIFNFMKALPAILGGVAGGIVGGPLGAAAGAGLGQLGQKVMQRLTGPVTPEQAGGLDPGYGKDIKDALEVAGTTAAYGGTAYGLQKAAPLLQQLTGGRGAGNIPGRMAGKQTGKPSGFLSRLRNVPGAGKRIGGQLDKTPLIPQDELQGILQSPQAQELMFTKQYATLPGERPGLIQDLLSQVSQAPSTTLPNSSGTSPLQFIQPRAVHEIGQKFGHQGTGNFLNRLLSSYNPNLSPELSSFSLGKGITGSPIVKQSARAIPYILAWDMMRKLTGGLGDLGSQLE